MSFSYFDVQSIFEETEREQKGDFTECLETYETTGFSHRWIQPPVACYFVTTMDKKGNVNCTPVSMGTAFQSAPPNMRWCYAFAMNNDRDGRKNLDETGECVISYYPYELLRESTIVGLPMPKGINEIDVAGLTPLPSKKVKPYGIAECVSNLEAKVIETVRVDGSTLYVFEIVAVSVKTEYMERDKVTPHEPGLGAADLLFEVSIKGNPPRLNYTRMDKRVYPTPDDIGCDARWIGTFEEWMDSEERRGKIDAETKEKILKLNDKWKRDPDPISNAKVKKKLTKHLKKICSDTTDLKKQLKKNKTKVVSEQQKDHEAIRNKVGYYDFTHKLLKVTGSDASAFLDKMFVADISGAGVGTAKYTTMLNEGGEIIDDVIVFHIDANTYWVSTLYIDELIAWFDRHRTYEAVSYKEITDITTMYAVQGPNSREVINQILKNPIDELKHFHIEDNQIDAMKVKIARSGYTGELGYEIYCAPSDAAHIEQALEKCGRAYGIRRIDTDVIVTSIPREKGYVLMSDLAGTNPLETGFGWTVDWNKEFVGKEALRRAKKKGVKRSLVGFLVPEVSAHVQAGDDVKVNGRNVGKVTMFTYGYTIGQNIGFALIDTDMAKVGDAAVIGNFNTGAILTERCFYDVSNSRVRG